MTFDAHKAASLWRPVLAVLTAILLWGAIPAILKQFSRELDPATLIGTRYTLSGLVFIPIVLRGVRRGVVAPRVFLVALLPAATFMLGQFLWTYAPYHNDASIIMFIGRAAFLFSLFWGFLLLKDERSMVRYKRFFLGSILTVGGLVFLFISAQQSGASTPFGFALMIVVAFFWGIQGTLIKKCMHAIPPLLGIGMISILTVPFALMMLFGFGTPRDLLALSATHWGLMVLSSMVSIAVGQALTFYAFQKLGPVSVEGAFQSVPFIAAAVAAIWLGEALTRAQWLAGTVIVVGAVCLLSIRPFPNLGKPRCREPAP